MSQIVPTDLAQIKKAADLLKKNQLIGMPTETVYGLAGNALSDHAVAAIYAAKGRPQFNPLIIHGTDIEMMKQYGVFNDQAELLAQHFWPGPLTMILERTSACPISMLASAGLSTIALRVPAHSVAQQLLAECGLPLAAPSANKSGKISATTPLHVATAFGDEVAMVLAGGKSRVGLESTVIDMTSRTPTILRPGAVTKEDLEMALGITVLVADHDSAIKSPGQMKSHYAPRAKVRLNAESAHDDEAFLLFANPMFQKGGKRRLNLSEAGDLTEAAANLFAYLHDLDQPDIQTIAVAPIPETGLGVAINDRLMRAASDR